MDRHPTRGAASEPVVVHPGVAAREMARDAEIERWARGRVRALKHFYSHLTLFSIVNFVLLLADLTTPGEPWFFYPLLAWGLVVGLHATQAYELLPWFTRDWEHRKLEELIEERTRR